MRKAVLLDRDGTINLDHGYLHRVELLEFLPGVIDSLRSLQHAGYLLIIITNQSGIGRGYFTQSQYKEFNDALCDALNAEGIQIAATYMCPHAPEQQCSCRKPNPTMALRAIEEFEIDTKASYMFGDKPSDVECGEAAGLTSRLITDTKGLEYWAGEIINKRL